MKSITFFEVRHEKGGLIGKDSNYSFDTEQEAIDMATEFKNNPRSHNEKMSDENVNYWKTRTYVIVKKIIQTEEITKI